MPSTDDLGRPLIGDLLKQQMNEALGGIAPGKRGALLLVGDASGNSRFQVAANLNGNWKVAAGVGYNWQTHDKPEGFVAVVGSW